MDDRSAVTDRPEQATKPWGDGSVAFPFAGEVRTFNIGRVKSLRELQAACDMGPMEVLIYLQTGRYRVEHYREVIRIGLLGGGMPQAQVAWLMEHHVDAQPPIENVTVAKAILSCGLSWPKDDALGERQAGNRTETSSTSEGASGSPQSSDKPQPSTGPLASSTTSPSEKSLPPSRDTIKSTEASATTSR